MTPRDLVVFLEPGEHGSDQRLAFAAGLAKRWAAHLIATLVTRPLVLEPHADYAFGTALTSLLVEHRKKTEAAIADARARFDALVQRRSFTAEWRVSENELPDAMMLHARHASLAILGPPARQRSTTTILGLAEKRSWAPGGRASCCPTSGRTTGSDDASSSAGTAAAKRPVQSPTPCPS